MTAVFVYGYRDIGKFLLHLVGLVTDVSYRCLRVGHHKALALPLVSSAEHGNMERLSQQVGQVFHMGRLAGTANGDVADGNDRDVKRACLEDTDLKEGIPQLHAPAVNPAEGQ